jgi:hypothetical protein
LSTSCPTALIPELLELSLPVEDVAEVDVDDEVLGIEDSNVVSALCAPAMLLSDSAVDTLDRNSLIGSFELVLDELFEPVSCSTWARYFLASLVSPDLIEENKSLRALLSELWLLLEELDVDDADEAESSAMSEELLCIAESDMDRNPFLANFSEQHPQ